MPKKQSQLKHKVKGLLYMQSFTMHDLAKNMGVSPPSLSMYLSGNMNMSNALLLNDTLHRMTGHTLTLEDFRK